MLIAGVSTVMFNGNPLLRYDGYYILADLVQIPNLRIRANQYLAHLVETKLFGVQAAAETAHAEGERAWLAFFAVASFLYRTFVMCAIALFIATQYFVIGVLLALWAVVASMVIPLVKGVGYLLMHGRAAPQARARPGGHGGDRPGALRRPVRRAVSAMEPRRGRHRGAGGEPAARRRRRLRAAGRRAARGAGGARHAAGDLR